MDDVDRSAGVRGWRLKVVVVTGAGSGGGGGGGPYGGATAVR